MPHTLPGQVSALVSLLVCAYALWRGRTPERAAAVTLLVGTLLYGLVQDRVHWLDPQRRLLAIDMSGLVVFAALVSSTRRIWLIPATALMLQSAALHVVMLFKRNIGGLAYIGMENLLGYGILFCLGYGTSLIDLQRRRHGRAVVVAADAEADRLIRMHGADVAAAVARRLYRHADRGRRRVLDRVLAAISERSGRMSRGDAATRWRRDGDR